MSDPRPSSPLVPPVDIDELVDALTDLLARRLAWQHHCAEEQRASLLDQGETA
jgi:hypothetical protein